MSFIVSPATPGPSRIVEKLSEPPRASTSHSHYGRPPLDSPSLSQINEDSPLRSPALSVISKNSTTVNKRLFNGDGNYGRTASTPFPGTSQPTAADPLAEIQNIGLNPRKRRLDALFGDIQDIDDDGSEFNFCQQGTTKKTKTEEEVDMELIERILEARKHFQAVINPTKSSGLARAEALHRFKMQNLSYSLPKYVFCLP